MSTKKDSLVLNSKNEATSVNTAVIIISDLHLTPDAPEILSHLENFLIARKAIPELYILGDLFEYWLGDDASMRMGYSGMENILKALVEDGVRVYFAAGNRDFLVGSDFTDRTGVQLLDEVTTRTFLGHSALLLHGDSLCIDDTRHQEFRSTVSDTQWREEFLSKSLDERHKIGRAIRFQSNIEKRYKAAEIMDVNQSAAEKLLGLNDARLLIHGHTHRPGIHTWTLNEVKYYRVVLGDWSSGPSWLEIEQDSLRLYHGDTIEELTATQIQL